MRDCRRCAGANKHAGEFVLICATGLPIVRILRFLRIS